jgi:nucleotide-binding universal stress UspA family protein
MKILLAADGSEYSLKAAAFLASHPGWLKDVPKLYVHTVHPPVPYAAAAATVGKKVVDDYYTQECKAALAPVCEALTAAGVAHEESYSIGDIAGEIRDFVARNGVDLVVIGSHGRSALANVALGSVATKIIAMLQVPVLVVR